MTLDQLLDKEAWDKAFHKSFGPDVEKMGGSQMTGANDQQLKSGNKALVFISHDSRDADLAEAFGNLLSDASGGVLKAFRSSDKKGTAGIEYGAEWYQTIMAQIANATDVVALLTTHSVNRPWILYEAGVAKGKLDTKVLGIALGINFEQVLTGPFAQFQNSADDEDSLTKLVLQLIRRNPDADPREEAVRRQVVAFRDNIGTLLKTRSKAVAPAKVDDGAVAKLFEEVKVMFSSLPETVESRLQESMRPAQRRIRRRFHPGMIEELIFHVPFGNDKAGLGITWLVLMSFVPDEAPWLREIGREVYHAVIHEDKRALKDAMHRFELGCDMLRHPLWERFIEPSDREAHMVLRHFGDFARHWFEVAIRSSDRRHKAEPADEKGKSRNSAGG